MIPTPNRLWIGSPKVAAMRCPYCKKDNDKVIDTRPSDDALIIRRRRECIECSHRFTTHERIEDLPLRIVKKSGARQSFNREKILAGVLRALEKRPPGQEAAEALVDEIERELLDLPGREVGSREVGALAMEKLRQIDEVAYVRFASVYKEFQAVDEFVREIQAIRQDVDSP